MNEIIVDTSVWVDFFSSGNSAVEEALKLGKVALPPIVVSELLSGIQKEKDKRLLVDFLSKLPLCDSSFDHWIRVGNLRSQLLAKGFSLSTPDAHICQCTLDVEGTLLTKDKIFVKIQKFLPLRIYK